MMIEDDELRGIYKTASEEHLQSLDNGLLHLEKHPDDLSVIESLMREAHSLKGDSNMLGVKDVGSLAHQIEHILSQLKQQKAVFDHELGDRLAHGITAIRQLVQEAVTGEPATVNTFNVLAVLMGGKLEEGAASQVTEPKPSHSPVTYAEDYDLAAYEREYADQQHHEPHPHEDVLPYPGLEYDWADEHPLQHEVAAEVDLTPPTVELAIPAAVSDQPSPLATELAAAAQLPPPTGMNGTANGIANGSVPTAVTNGPNGTGSVGGQPTVLDSPTVTVRSSHNPTTVTATHTPNVHDDYQIETIRIPTRSLDHLMTQVGELTVTKIRIAHRLAEIESLANVWDEWSRQLLHDTAEQERLKGQRSRSEPRDTSHTDLPKFNGGVSKNQRRLEDRLNQIDSLIGNLRKALYEDTARLKLIGDELEDGIRTLRLLPMSTIFNFFPRMVRDLARQEGKQVELVMSGSDTRADKRILEQMKDPLMHLIRNAIDHGIERPEERDRLGKPPTATIHLRSYQTPTNIVIEVQDDGHGLDVERIKHTAVKRGICREEELASMDVQDIHSLIFKPGFSTAPLVTEVSGRGVGLDVVQTNVEKLKGAIEIHSTPGRGCLFRIQLGITLATAHVLIVLIHDTPYAIPVEFVRTACLVKTEDLFTLEGRDTIVRDGQPVSVANLADLLELSSEIHAQSLTQLAQQNQTPCIILQSGREQLGVFVDALIDEQDVVIKPQSQLLKRVRNVSGATILGTGEVCMVLNPQDLIKSVQRRTSPTSIIPTQQLGSKKHTVLLVEDSIATRTQEKRMLEAAGYEVITAVDGSDGWKKLQTQAFDAIISDIQMPNLDGLQLTEKIRQQRKYNELPIILVTSLASDEDKRRGAEAGANAYITKNILNQEILIETLQRLI